MKIRIQHHTAYRYAEEVAFGPHRILVRPREGHDLHIESSILEISPAHQIHWLRDVNGNSIAVVTFTQPAQEMKIYSEIVLNHYDADPLDFNVEKYAEHYPFVYDPWSQPELTSFMSIIYPNDTDEVKAWLEQFWKPGTLAKTVTLLQAITTHIHDNFTYTRRDEPGVQHPAETLRKKSGSCRDFATLFIEACRCWGLAARFVSGYMLCEATEAGGASTHAWAEVYLPGAGWKGFDPTCGQLTGWQHVAVAVSRHPEAVNPVSGSFLGVPGASLTVEVKVEQLDKPAPLLPENSATLKATLPEMEPIGTPS